jgi:molecular chaperone GrpE
MTTPHDKKDRRTQTRRAGQKAGAAGPKPVAATPADQAPAGPTQADQAPADTAPVAATPPDQAPAGLRPVAAAPVDAAPVDELRAAIAERDQYLDHLQRLKAEFENYRKRVQRDNEALVLRAGEGVLESLLPVLDNMARALESAERHEEGQLIKGVELVSGQLRAVLESHGLDEVPAAPGLPFDPNVHEAVAAQASADYPEGLITTVLESGYLLHGRLLRPARVIVAS